MRTLKEQMQLDNVAFLNPKDFGEEMLVDGLPCYGMWDEEYMPVQQFFGAGMDVMGVHTIERLLFVMPQHPGDFLPLPVPEQVLEIDKTFWTVRDAVPEAGIFKLTLYRNES